MIRRRLSWVIVGGAVALLVVAGVDALRSSESETSASPTSASTTTVESVPPRCTLEQIGISIEILGGYATAVVRNVSGAPCHLQPLPIQATLTDQGGRKAMRFQLVEQQEFGGDFLPGFQETATAGYIENCHLRGPFLLVVSAGPYSARRSKLSPSEIGCSFPQ